jgi:predicted DNA-binding transcriptional regulator AlpA
MSPTKSKPRDEVLRAYKPQPNFPDPLVGTAEVAAIIGCHVATVFKRMHGEPDFPRPIRISANRLAWRMSAINRYIDTRPTDYEPKKVSLPPTPARPKRKAGKR